MSERFNVNASEVLGTGYKVTSISCSTYNPSIDSTTTTVTVTVKDVYGDAVSGESVVVTASGGVFTALNGSSITESSSVTGATNPSGQFTLTYKASDWGNISISANNACKQLYVTGWKEVTLASGSSYGNLYVNGAERIAYFRYYRTNYNITATTTYTLHSGAIPSDYRPTYTTNCAMLRADLTGSVGTNGDISIVAWDTGTRTINMTTMWKY